jgi:hypothetical protein
MENQEPIQLDLEVSLQDATEEDIDLSTRGLLNELRDLDVESLELNHAGYAPAGTKSIDPVIVGSIAIKVLPVLLPKLVDFIQAWALRGQGRTVKIKGKIAGQTIQMEGSAEDLQKLIKALSKTKPS